MGTVTVITGSQEMKVGGGKSWTGIRLGEMLDPTFDVSQVCFSPREFLEAMNRVEASGQYGKVVILDEAAVSIPSSAWFSVSNKMIHYCLTTNRYLRANTILITPSFSFIDSRVRSLINFWGVAHRYHRRYDNKRGDKVSFRFYRVKTDPFGDKIWRQRVTMYDRDEKQMNTFNSFTVGRPSPTLSDAYEVKSREFKKNLREGLITQIDKFEQKEAGISLKESNAMKLTTLVPRALDDAIIKQELQAKGKVTISTLMNQFQDDDKLSYMKATRLAKLVNQKWVEEA